MSLIHNNHRNLIHRMFGIGLLSLAGLTAGCHEAPAERHVANDRHMWFMRESHHRAEPTVYTGSVEGGSLAIAPSTAPTTQEIASLPATAPVLPPPVWIDPVRLTGLDGNAAQKSDPQLRPRHGYAHWIAGPSTPDPLLAAPPTDAATDLRDFPRSTCYYENQSVPAGPTYTFLAPAFGRSESAKDISVIAITGLPTFIGSALSAPFIMLVQPPWTPKMWHEGTNYPPSFTVAPPAEKEKR